MLLHNFSKNTMSYIERFGTVQLSVLCTQLQQCILTCRWFSKAEIRENVKKRGTGKEGSLAIASSFIQIRALLSYCFPFLLSEGIIMVHLSLDG